MKNSRLTKVGYWALCLGLFFSLPGEVAGQGCNPERCKICVQEYGCATFILPGACTCVDQGAQWCEEMDDECSPQLALRMTSPEGGFRIPETPGVRAELAVSSEVSETGITYLRACNGSVVARVYTVAAARRVRDKLIRILI